MARKKLVWTLVGTLLIAFGGLLAVLLTGTHPALGLDLQGGVSVTKQPKNSNYTAAGLDLTIERLRERVDSIGVAEPEILRQGETVVVNLPGVKDTKKAIEMTNISGKVYLRPVFSCQDLPPKSASTTTTIAGTTPGTDAGAGSTPAGGSSAPSSGWRRTQTSTPTTTGETPAGSTPAGSTPAGSTPDTTPGTTADTTAPADIYGPSDPTKTQIRPIRVSESSGGGFCQVGPAGGTGEVFSGDDDDTRAAFGNGGWEVVATLRDGSAGMDVWNALVRQCFGGAQTCPGRQIAIELDGEIISHPTLRVGVWDNNSVSITGGFTETEARNLADVIKSGALPVELKTIAVQNVSPTLGKDSLHAAIIAGLVGVGLVLLFMAFYYRHLGLIAAAGLCVSGALLWTIISLLSRTQGLALSLAGVAGVIVSVGVTIDSYVVFFERLKDEVRAGRTMRNSAQRGFSAAWRTIVVADLVSLIGALVLWYLTVGSVRNFAFFLGLSTLTDLAVSWFFTRPAVLLLARTSWMGRRKVMGIEAPRELNIAGGAR